MGREGTGRFTSAKQMLAEWERYKERCDNMSTVSSGFSAKNSEFVSAEIPKRVTCTIKGFALWCGMTERNFYATYDRENSKFQSVIARIKEECEIDAREKFELGEIDPRLAPLWMSNYGYTTKTDQNVSGAATVVFSGEDDLVD